MFLSSSFFTDYFNHLLFSIPNYLFDDDRYIYFIYGTEKCVAKAESKWDISHHLCKERSKTKKGICFSSTACTLSCVKEKAVKGQCSGFLPRCYCFRFKFKCDDDDDSNQSLEN